METDISCWPDLKLFIRYIYGHFVYQSTTAMKTLIMGAYGQVGIELIRALSSRIGAHNIVCSDIREPPSHLKVPIHETVNSIDPQAVDAVIKKHQIQVVYCLPALLSATGEINPMVTEQINMRSLYNCLEAAKRKEITRMFWPSSIAAFGPDTPKKTPQQTIMNPGSAYGITKKAGELWCAYYANKFGVDVRSVRFPGLIGYRSAPGGGTTDYAVEIFHSALKGQTFQCPLSSRTFLPMMYIDDAIGGTLDLMDAPRENLQIKTSYNINSMSFCPEELAKEIKKHKPDFKIQYKIDPIKQGIADSWPHRLLDYNAREDWGFLPRYDMSKMTVEILNNLKV